MAGGCPEWPWTGTTEIERKAQHELELPYNYRPKSIFEKMLDL